MTTVAARVALVGAEGAEYPASPLPSPWLATRPVRRESRGLVLRAMLRHGPVSRADVARLTGLSRPTVSEVVRDLLEEQIVVEADASKGAGPGRPGTLLVFHPSGAQVVAIDLSDPRHLHAALSTPGGNIMQRRRRPRRQGGGLGADVIEMIREVEDQAGENIVAIVIATSGHGKIVEELRRAVRVPVHVFDPADLAADIEYLLGEHGGGSLVLIQAGADVAVAVRECDAAGVLLERPAGAHRLSSSVWSLEELAPSLAVLASALGVPSVVVSGVHARPLAGMIRSAVRCPHVRVSVSVLDDSVARAAALAVALRRH